MSQTRLVEVREKVLNKNDLAARVLRTHFEEAGVCVISLVSSPGAGKTAFLERVLTSLRGEYRVAALVGDLATDNDAMRLARSQAPVKQISTGTICHLDAGMVSGALEGWELVSCPSDSESKPTSVAMSRDTAGTSAHATVSELHSERTHWDGLPDKLDFLFIENVGNLVCPSSYDLGEQARMVLLSVTEGEDKPLKYPTIFHTADAAVLTKMDLAVAVEFSSKTAHQNIQSVRPGMRVFEVSAKTGEGMDNILGWMKGLHTVGRAALHLKNG